MPSVTSNEVSFMQMYENETIMEIASEDDVHRVAEAARQVEKKLASPYSGNLVEAPIHAVVTIQQDLDVALIKTALDALSQRVTTFEIRLGDNADTLDWGNGLNLSYYSKMDRIMITGLGERPVLFQQNIDVRANVVQIANLDRGGSNMRVDVARALLLDQVLFHDKVTSPRFENLDQSMLTVNLREDAKTSFAEVALNQVQFKNNQGVGLVSLVNGKTRVFNKIMLKDVVVDSNQSRKNIRLAVSDTIEIDRAEVRNNLTYAFEQVFPTADVTIRNSRLSGPVYTYYPLAKDKDKACKPFTLINNETTDDADCTQDVYGSHPLTLPGLEMPTGPMPSSLGVMPSSLGAMPSTLGAMPSTPGVAPEKSED